MTIDIIIVILIGILCFQGYRKGFIKTLFDTLGVVVSFFLSKELYYIAENFLLKNTKLFVRMHDYFEIKLSDNIVSSLNDNIPAELQNFVSRILSSDAPDAFAAFVDNISLLAIRSISYLITFLVIYAVLLALSSMLDLIMKFPILNLTNRIFGGLTGILKGVILLYLVFALAAPLISFMQDKPLTQSVLNSESSKIFYENNILLNYFAYKGFYDS